ncbi:MAG: hypothetical protein P4L58_02740 [Candidatus Pacebacteria bacterium]|nr:hypothetical protein [Candidatus Paceibacterota bacterium]
MNAERKFLHDISSPFTTLQLNIENVILILEEGKPEEIAECVTMLNSSIAQIKRATEMIRARREVLIEKSK